MSSSNMDVGSEQLCYIPCKFCNIVLAVSVPCSSLCDIVTVRCGHCSNLWSVNMAAAFQSLSWQEVQFIVEESEPVLTLQGRQRSIPLFIPRISFVQSLKNRASGLSNLEQRIEMGSSSRGNNRIAMRAPTTRIATEERAVTTRPPEKRQRVPSAYNQFIKEEIQRIKVNNPDISHREAFSTAAKNWAHFPHIHFGLMLEANNQARSGN